MEMECQAWEFITGGLMVALVVSETLALIPEEYLQSAGIIDLVQRLIRHGVSNASVFPTTPTEV